MVENLDHLLPVHRLLHVAFQFRNRALQADKELRRAAAQLGGNQHHQHHARHYNQRQPDAVVQHDEEDRDHNRPRADQRRERLPHQLAERVDIVGVVTHNVAVLVRVEIADRQILHPVEHGLSHFVEEALRDVRRHLRFKRHRKEREHVETDQHQHLRYDNPARFRPRRAVLGAFDDRVGHLLEEDRRNRRRDCREQDADNRNRNCLGVVAEQHLHHAPELLEIHFPLAARTAHRRARRHFLIHLLHFPHLRSFAVHRPRGKSGCSPSVRRVFPSPQSARCSSPQSGRRPVPKPRAAR